jgi:hypothetical protein
MEHIKFKNDAQMFLSYYYQMKAKLYIINPYPANVKYRVNS